jgi:hypothetical protein
MLTKAKTHTLRLHADKTNNVIDRTAIYGLEETFVKE